LVKLAVIANAVKVAEKIEGPDFVGGGGAQNAAPYFRSVETAHRFAICVGFGEFQANGANI
jgi:hypothetical protein